MNEQQAFAETRLHDALDQTLESAPVPPLPYASIVRAGARRRRARCTLGGLAVGAAALLAGVLATTPWPGGSEVTPSASAPGTVSSASPESLPVRDKLPTGVLGGAHWSLRVEDYPSPGRQNCELWRVAVNGREDQSMKGHCFGTPHDRYAGTLTELDVRRDPDDHTSPQLGALFASDLAPQGVVAFRVTWPGSSITAPIFRLRGDATHRWYVLALPYVPAHASWYRTLTLTYLDAHGRGVSQGWSGQAFPNQYPPAN